jgi:PHP family Zn ribbon phosphoesterase
VGPAHAFTPYKSIFREGRYESIAACYGDEALRVCFLELGLSADTEMADCMPELNRMTFISSSDAHSPTPDRLGREFVRLRMEAPTYDELAKALRREAGRRPVLNLGLNPRLGKYYLSFCSSCRRTLTIRYGNDPPQFDDLDIYLSVPGPNQLTDLLNAIHMRKVSCPACGKRLRLGVRDRVMMIGQANSVSPDHRPPYRHMPPLLELLSVAHASAASTVSVRRIYGRLLSAFGTEIDVLTEVGIEAISEVDSRVSRVIEAYRSGRVRYRPGGGGRYGHVLPLEEVASP